MHSDPIADMLTRIRNACRARLARVDIPWSTIKLGIAEVLKREGFVDDVRQIAGPTAGRGVIEVKLRYDERGAALIGDLQRVSRPGLRRYFGSSELPKVRSGMGLLILTTSKGIMTDREARQAGLGGEALCSVW